MIKKEQKWNWTGKQEKALRELKKQFIKKPVLAAPDLDKKNENESGHVRLCNRGHVINGMQEWEIEASNISLQIPKRDREKL